MCTSVTSGLNRKLPKSDGRPPRCSQRDRVQLRSSVFNGRPYCYSSVSFSLLLRSSVFNGGPYCYSSVCFSLLLLLLFFFLLDFSEMRGRISLKFSEVVGTGLAQREFQFDVRTSLPVGDMVHFLFSLSSGFLKNRSRYRVEIFRDCNLVISTLMLRVSLIQVERH